MPIVNTVAKAIAKPIPRMFSPKAHAILDYLNVACFLVGDAVFWRRSKSAALGSLICGTTQLAISLVTDYPGGMAKAISFRKHGEIDLGLAAMTDDLNVMLAHFIRSQIILAGLSTVIYTAVLLSLRYPFAFVLAVASGLMEFVPVVGPVVAAISILGVGFLTGYSHLGIIVLILAAWRIVQDYVISPRIMGGKLELHPLAAILAVMAGGEIAGVLGVYLAIPAMAASRIIWKRARRYPESFRVSYPTAA
jgi:hypothetical protein